METIGNIAMVIVIVLCVIFLIATRKWDKEREQGKNTQHSENGNSIAKFLFYLFIIAFIVATIAGLKDCSGADNVPFEETIRHN